MTSIPKSDFLETWTAVQSQTARLDLDSVTPSEVQRALAAEQVGFHELRALLAPAARDYLEQMAQRARRITLARFGRTIQLYAPVYLSNACTNRCIYCGFNVSNDFARVTLTPEELLREADYLKKQGFQHILLLTGEDHHAVPLKRLTATCQELRERFASVSIEVYPLDEAGYRSVVAAGVDGLTLYQETYHRPTYEKVHLGGPKRNYERRLAAVEAAGRAGMRRIGIGALLGLADWRQEAFALFVHADWLMKQFWRTQITLSFPRLRSASGAMAPPQPVSDAELAQMLCALRIALPDVGLVVSTREEQTLRDGLIPLGVTQMSAGSRTEPGGYLRPAEEEAQFCIEDQRSPEQVAGAIRAAGYDPVWKDWDPVLSG